MENKLCSAVVTYRITNIMVAFYETSNTLILNVKMDVRETKSHEKARISFVDCAAIC